MWRQGSLIPHDLPGVADVLTRRTQIGAGDRVVLISHDCDICHDDFGAEPEAEIIIARKLTDDQENQNYYHGKNPRKFQFQMHVDGQRQSYEMSFRERHSIPRILLTQRDPYP